MNVFTRCWLFVRRSPFKSLLFMALVFILGNLILGSFLIQDAARRSEENFHRQLPAIAGIEFNQERFADYSGQRWLESERSTNTSDLSLMEWSYWWMPSEITREIVEQLSNLSYVRTADYPSIAFLAYSPLLQHVRLEDIPFYHHSHWDSFFLRGMINPYFELNTGQIAIQQGRNFTAEELSPSTEPIKYALVTEAFASLNHLGIGSQLRLEDHIAAFDENVILGLRPYYFTIIGTFRYLQPVRGYVEQMMHGAEEDRLNSIIIPDETLNYLRQHHRQDLQRHDLHEQLLFSMNAAQTVNPTFLLHDPMQLSDFRSAAQNMLPPYWQIYDLTALYEPMRSSLDSLTTITRWFLIGGGLALILLLILLSVFLLSERKKEIGIYLALGEKKWRVVMQLKSELLLLSIAAMLLAIASSTVIANGFSRHLLHREMLLQQEANDPWANPDESGTVLVNGIYRFAEFLHQDVIDQRLDAFQPALTATSIILFLVSGLLIVSLTTTFSLVYTLNTISPKTLLSLR